MGNQWGYVDPVQRAHEDMQYRQFMRPQAQTYSPMPYQPVAPFPLETVQSPLANLPQATYEIFSNRGAVPQQRHQSVVGKMIVGAIIGGLLGRWLDRRRALKAQEDQRVRESLGVAHLEEDEQPAPAGKHHKRPARQHGPMSGH